LNARVKVAVIGLGKIAHDQHLPAIARSPDFQLVAAASPSGSAPGVPNFATVGALLDSGIAFDAVVMCQPPQLRFQAAALALRAGKHVLLEKPPGASASEVEQLRQIADRSDRTLFAAWHSRYAPAVAPALQWLQGRTIRAVQIQWREDVRQWHPDQAWIWQPGGLGVFDPGINALSILTVLVSEPLRVTEGTLEIPANRFTPIAAEVYLQSLAELPVHAVFDWRQQGEPIWTIDVQTDSGRLRLSAGGAVLQVGEEPAVSVSGAEYPALYERFAALIRAGQSDVDVEPLRLVADACLRCRIQVVADFA
jgi:D-galactose 1-dehydrogenase